MIAFCQLPLHFNAARLKADFARIGDEEWVLHVK